MQMRWANYSAEAGRRWQPGEFALELAKKLKIAPEKKPPTLSGDSCETGWGRAVNFPESLGPGRNGYFWGGETSV